MLELQKGEDLLFGGKSVTISVGTAPFSSLPIDLLTLDLFAGKQASAERDINRLLSVSLNRLAQVRAWRHVKTEGPPASLLPSDLLWDAVARAKISPKQHLIDLVHRAIVDEYDGETDMITWPVRWATPDREPELVEECADLVPNVYIEALSNNRWLAGRMWPNALQVTCYGRDELVVLVKKPLRKAPRRSGQTFEIRTKCLVSETLANAAVGRRVQDVIEEPLVATLGGIIVAAEVIDDSMRFRISAECAAPPPAVTDHVQQLAKELDRLAGRKDAVAAELKRALHRV
jgi:hypothetical protein